MIDKLFARLRRPEAARVANPELDEFKRKHTEFFGEPQETDQLELSHLPLLPLRDLVLFPEVSVSVLVGRPESVNAVEAALADNKLVAAISQRDEDKSFINPEHDLYRVGVVAEVTQHVRLPDGSLRLTLSGIERFRVVSFFTAEGVGAIEFELMEDDAEIDELEAEAARRYLIEQMTLYIQSLNRVPEELLVLIENLSDIGRYHYVLANHLPGGVAAKQRLLEIPLLSERMKKIGSLLNKESQISDIGNDIRSKAAQKLKQAEKDYVLREQMKIIQQELKDNGGEGGEADLLLARLESLKLPEKADKQARTEIERLQKMPPYSPEAGMIRSYIDVLLDVPWHERTEDNFTLGDVRDTLDADHYGLDKVKERILEFLAVRKQAPESRSAVLCLVGPPGTGKTSLAKSIAEAMGRKFVRISLGGVRDEAEIRGHRRTYIGSMPGRVVKAMKQAGVVNPVILLDEVDKMDSDLRGDPTAALLEVLDPEQNAAFNDHFLEVDYDLSQVLFIATANSLYTIPEPLLDRLELIQLSSYTEDEKFNIARQHLIPKQIREHGLTERCTPKFSEAVTRRIIVRYTREAGVRELERKIAQICRKVVKEIVQDKQSTAKTVQIDAKLVRKYLGPERFNPEEKEKEDQIGLATGLAWTEVGGEIMPIEVTLMQGKGDLVITGQLGEVMQESAKAALSYIRAREKEFKLPRNFSSKTDLHIHVPEGAVPKDGPSAGIAIASALISALTKRAVYANVAMTGEITLRGRVLPIGGLKEKVLAAHRAGIEKVIIPQKNLPDLEEIPSDVRRKLAIVSVESMDDVLKNVIVAAAKTTRRYTRS